MTPGEFVSGNLDPFQGRLAVDDWCPDAAACVGGPWAERIEDLLPGTTLVYLNGPSKGEVAQQRVFIGRIVDVEPGVGRYWDEDFDSGDELNEIVHLVPFDDPQGTNHTVHLVVEPLRELGANDERPAGPNVRIGFRSLGMSLDELRREFLSVGPALFFVGPAGDYYKYDPSLVQFRRHWGDLFATIGPAGELAFPLDNEKEMQRLLHGFEIDDLHRASMEARSIGFRYDGSTYIRVEDSDS